jgi:hypothetical protein
LMLENDQISCSDGSFVLCIAPAPDLFPRHHLERPRGPNRPTPVGHPFAGTDTGAGACKEELERTVEMILYPSSYTLHLPIQSPYESHPISSHRPVLSPSVASLPARPPPNSFELCNSSLEVAHSQQR